MFSGDEWNAGLLLTIAPILSVYRNVGGENVRRTNHVEITATIYVSSLATTTHVFNRRVS